MITSTSKEENRVEGIRAMNRKPLENENQYKVTCEWVGKFNESIRVAEEQLKIFEGDERMCKLLETSRDAARSILADLVWEKEDWEKRNAM